MKNSKHVCHPCKRAFVQTHQCLGWDGEKTEVRRDACSAGWDCSMNRFDTCPNKDCKGDRDKLGVARGALYSVLFGLKEGVLHDEVGRPLIEVVQEALDETADTKEGKHG